MGSKYPTPEEAVSNFLMGVDAAVGIWQTRTKAGSGKLGNWFSRLFPKLYPLIARLPARGVSRTGNVTARSAPVAELVGKEAEAYRKEKIRKLAEVLVPA